MVKRHWTLRPAHTYACVLSNTHFLTTISVSFHMHCWAKHCECLPNIWYDLSVRWHSVHACLCWLRQLNTLLSWEYLLSAGRVWQLKLAGSMGDSRFGFLPSRRQCCEVNTKEKPNQKARRDQLGPLSNCKILRNHLQSKGIFSLNP